MRGGLIRLKEQSDLFQDYWDAAMGVDRRSRLSFYWAYLWGLNLFGVYIERRQVGFSQIPSKTAQRCIVDQFGRYCYLLRFSWQIKKCNLHGEKHWGQVYTSLLWIVLHEWSLPHVGWNAKILQTFIKARIDLNP